MPKILILILASGYFACSVSAQVSVVLQQDLLTMSDTLWVDVRIGQGGVLEGSQIEPVHAFSFSVKTSKGIRFLGSSETFTLIDRNGWSSAFNVENGRVGGFASSRDALVRGGILIRLQFLLTGTDTYEELELNNFRLNSGSPDHIPSVPSLRIDIESHVE